MPSTPAQTPFTAREPSARPIPAVLLGYSFTALGVMRALGRRGIQSFMATPAEGFASRSRWYRVCPGASEDHPSPEELASFLESCPLERAVLFPCADDWVRAVASLPPALQQRFPSSVAEPSTIAALQDKARLATLLDELDVPHPRTYILSSREDLERLPVETFDQAFLKPRDSLSFLRQHGTKAFTIHGKSDALARLSELGSGEPEVMLQEYVPASMADHYFIDGFVDRNRRVRCRFARRRLRMWPPDFGGSSFVVSIPLSETREATEALDRIFAGVPYRGIFSAEFVRDPRDGLFRFLEVNVRAFMHIEFATMCGADLPWLAYQDALGRPLEDVMEYQVGRRSVDLEGDLSAALHLIAAGRLGLFEWLRSCIGADGFAFAWDDPAPGIRRLPRVLQQQLRRQNRRGRRAT